MSIISLYSPTEAEMALIAGMLDPTQSRDLELLEEVWADPECPAVFADRGRHSADRDVRRAFALSAAGTAADVVNELRAARDVAWRRDLTYEDKALLPEVMAELVGPSLTSTVAMSLMCQVGFLEELPEGISGDVTTLVSFVDERSDQGALSSADVHMAAAKTLLRLEPYRVAAVAPTLRTPVIVLAAAIALRAAGFPTRDVSELGVGYTPLQQLVSFIQRLRDRPELLATTAQVLVELAGPNQTPDALIGQHQWDEVQLSGLLSAELPEICEAIAPQSTYKAVGTMQALIGADRFADTPEVWIEVVGSTEWPRIVAAKMFGNDDERVALIGRLLVEHFDAFGSIDPMNLTDGFEWRNEIVRRLRDEYADGDPVRAAAFVAASRSYRDIDSIRLTADDLVRQAR